MNADTTGTLHLSPIVRTAGRTSRPLRTRPRAALALAAALVAATLWAGAGPAAAHGDAGQITVTRAEQTGPNRIDLEVGVIHEDDGHLATEASVTATLVGPAGDTVGPVALSLVDPDSSLYAAQIDVPGPGSWAVTIDSTEPVATTQYDVDVIQSENTTTTAAAPSTTSPPSTTEAPVDGTGSAADTPLTAAADGSSGDNRWLLVGAAVAAVALVVIVTLALRRNSHDEVDDSLA